MFLLPHFCSVLPGVLRSDSHAPGGLVQERPFLLQGVELPGQPALYSKDISSSVGRTWHLQLQDSGFESRDNPYAKNVCSMTA